jgi:homocitrate synthase
VLAAPETYESIDPSDFGLKRQVHIAHRLTGWNAVRNRAQELGLSLTDEQVKAATQRIKALADQRIVTPEEVDEMLRAQAVLG